MARCKRCGELFKRTQRSQKYCEKCRKLSRDLLNGKVFDCEKEQTCGHCGTIFHANRKRKYCSDECCKVEQLDKEKGRRIKKQKCVLCGVEFESKQKKKYCSEECRSKRKRPHRKQKHKPIQSITCVCNYCGKEYHPKSADRTKYCSRECAFADQGKVLKENREGHKSGWKLGASDNRHRQRAKEYGVYYERIKPIEIYQRDGWRCKICGGKVNQELRFPHPLSATLDHIIPMSLCGTHEKKNVQLAHLSCNSSKHNKGNDQLILFG